MEINLGRVGGNMGRYDHISLFTGKEFSKNNLKYQYFHILWNSRMLRENDVKT